MSYAEAAIRWISSSSSSSSSSESSKKRDFVQKLLVGTANERQLVEFAYSVAGRSHAIVAASSSSSSSIYRRTTLKGLRDYLFDGGDGMTILDRVFPIIVAAPLSPPGMGSRTTTKDARRNTQMRHLVRYESVLFWHVMAAVHPDLFKFDLEPKSRKNAWVTFLAAAAPPPLLLHEENFAPSSSVGNDSLLLPHFAKQPPALAYDDNNDNQSDDFVPQHEHEHDDDVAYLAGLAGASMRRDREIGRLQKELKVKRQEGMCLRRAVIETERELHRLGGEVPYNPRTNNIVPPPHRSTTAAGPPRATRAHHRLHDDDEPCPRTPSPVGLSPRDMGTVWDGMDHDGGPYATLRDFLRYDFHKAGIQGPKPSPEMREARREEARARELERLGRLKARQVEGAAKMCDALEATRATPKLTRPPKKRPRPAE